MKTPNGWSCLAASFAHCLDLTVDQLCERIGHDGSQVLWPDLPEPERRRAFHPQEMIDVCLQLGYVAVPIEARPCSKTPRFQGFFEVPFRDGHAYRMNRHLDGGSGVLTGKNLLGRPHAVVWDGTQILDPAGRVVMGLWEPCSYERHLFQIETFWKIARAEHILIS